MSRSTRHGLPGNNICRNIFDDNTARTDDADHLWLRPDKSLRFPYPNIMANCNRFCIFNSEDRSA